MIRLSDIIDLVSLDEVETLNGSPLVLIETKAGFNHWRLNQAESVWSCGDCGALVDDPSDGCGVCGYGDLSLPADEFELTADLVSRQMNMSI